MYIFLDIRDLGFSHFYFSCKNCQELAQARITKVVGFFTTNLTKLSLHFSDISTISYGFYKNQQMALLFEMRFCSQPPRFSADPQPCPSFADKPSEVFLTLQCSPRGGGRRGSLESGELACIRGRERAGKGSPTPKGPIPGVGWPREAAGKRRTGGRRRWLP
jgi:hypothetical protein